MYLHTYISIYIYICIYIYTYIYIYIYRSNRFYVRPLCLGHVHGYYALARGTYACPGCEGFPDALVYFGTGEGLIQTG